MPGLQGIVRTGGRDFFRLAGLFTQAASSGRGALCALLLCAALGGGGCLWLAQSEAAALTYTSLPALNAALVCEDAIYEAAFHVSMFGATGDMANYSAGRIGLAALRNATTLLGERLRALPQSQNLGGDMDTLLDLTRRLDLVAEKKRTVTETITGQKTRLRRTADAMGEALLAMQALTESGSAGEGGDALNERARLLMLNGFALAVEEVTGRTLAAGVTKNPQDLATARTFFVERWQEAREAVNAAADLASGTGERGEVETMETQVGVYRDAMRAMLLSLEESERLNSERAEAVSRLTTAGREMVASIRTLLEENAAFIEEILIGGLLFLTVCAVACVVVVARGARRAGQQGGGGSC